MPDAIDHLLHADIIVQLVIVGLAVASLVTWTAFLAKLWELFTARRDVNVGIAVLKTVATIREAEERMQDITNPIARLLQAAETELTRSGELDADGIKERVGLRIDRLELAAGRKLMRGTGVLATIGSTAPFVGLFGTVWGIMNSFIGIQNAHTTNLAVVAPGIAEALMATAMGLVAAIPAVVTYNVLARSTGNYRALLGDASALVTQLVSRDLDQAELLDASATE
jgi:biopolymer transport protein ExbB